MTEQNTTHNYSVEGLNINNDGQWFTINLGPFKIDQRHQQTDDKMTYIKIPLDANNESTIRLREYLEKIDAYFESKEMKDKIFGNLRNKFQYSPCIKCESESEQNSEDDQSNN